MVFRRLTHTYLEMYSRIIGFVPTDVHKQYPQCWLNQFIVSVQFHTEILQLKGTILDKKLFFEKKFLKVN